MRIASNALGAGAVEGGFEPSTGQLGKGQIALASRWSTPISLLYFVIPAHETGGHVCQFQHSTIYIKELFNLQVYSILNPIEFAILLLHP